MEKIKWCLKVKNGIELIESNANLAEGYLVKAEEALETSKLAKSRSWKIAALYYALYFSLYSLLTRIGVKCEIHDCTIAFAKEFLTEYFKEEDLLLLRTAFKARNDAQYYVDREVNDEVYRELTRKVPDFLVVCKNTRIDERTRNCIRQKLSEF